MKPRLFGDELAAAVRKYLHENHITQRHLTGEMLADIGQRMFDHWQERQKARKKRGEATEQELAVYDAYPRKVARADAIVAIRSALAKVSQEELLQKTRHYGLCVGRWPVSCRYKEGRDLCPHPATWFNRESYLENEKEWLPAGMFARDDDKAENSGTASFQRPAPITEPQGWKEKLQNHPTHGMFVGREWENIIDYDKKQIIRLCTPQI